MAPRWIAAGEPDEFSGISVGCTFRCCAACNFGPFPVTPAASPPVTLPRRRMVRPREGDHTLARRARGPDDLLISAPERRRRRDVGCSHAVHGCSPPGTADAGPAEPRGRRTHQLAL